MIDASRFGDLAVARLLTCKEGRETRKKLKQALAPMLPDDSDASSFDGALEVLTSSGDVESVGQSLLLTRSGRARALAFLGMRDTPARPKWQMLRTRVLPYLALGVARSDAPRAKTAGEALVAAVLREREHLPVAPRSSADAVFNVLAWRAMGIESQAPFTRDAVLEIVLKRALDGKARPVKNAAPLLAAKHVGAKRADADGLSTALLREFLRGTANAPPSAKPSEGEPAFVARVVAAARRAKTGRFGDSKVFISHVHRYLDDDAMSLDTFKSRLVSAQRAGLLVLSRADLVGAMPEADVRDSETDNLGAVFHFVRAD